MRLTIATPIADLSDTRAFAVCVGWINGFTPEEWQGSFAAQWQDDAGNIYHVSSFETSAEWVASAAMMGPVDRPPEDVGTWDEEAQEYGAPYVVNLAGARRAQDRMVIWQPAMPDPETGEMPENSVPQASADTLVVVVGMSGRDALAAMGLRPLEVEV